MDPELKEYVKNILQNVKGSIKLKAMEYGLLEIPTVEKRWSKEDLKLFYANRAYAELVKPPSTPNAGVQTNSELSGSHRQDVVLLTENFFDRAKTVFIVVLLAFSAYSLFSWVLKRNR